MRSVAAAVEHHKRVAEGEVQRFGAALVWPRSFSWRDHDIVEARHFLEMRLNEVRRAFNFAPAILKVRLPDTALKSASPVKTAPSNWTTLSKVARPKSARPGPNLAFLKNISLAKVSPRNWLSSMKMAPSNQVSPEKPALLNAG